MTTQSEIERNATEAPTGETALARIENLPVRVESAEEYKIVVQAGRGFRDLVREIDQWFEGTKTEPGPKVQAHSLWKSLCDKHKAARSLPERGLKTAKLLLDGFDKKVRQEKAEAERKAREERERIEREAREESERLEAKATEEREEAERLKTEAREQKETAERLAAEPPGDPEDERKRQAELDVAAEDERDRLAAIADAERAAEDLDRAAERALEAPTRTPASFAAPVEEAPAVEGASKSEGWDFEIIDPTKIRVKVIRDAMRVVAAEKIKTSWLGQHLKKIVGAHGEAAGSIIGEGSIEVKTKTTRSFR